MSRLTGTDAYSLMEAYNAVYAPQELTEEQVWEEVENWVNSLLEEGYDLSDYTWEEMYEAYIEEAPVSPVFNTKGFGDFYNRQATSQGMDKTFRAGGGQAALRAGKTPLDIMKQGASNLRSSTSTRTPAAPAARPAAAAPAARPAAAAPAARPAAPAPTAARPAAPAPTAAKPAVGPTGKPLVGGIERRTPTSAELKAAQAARAGGGALAQATAAASKPAAFNPTPTASTPTPAARPATPARPTPRQARLNMEMEYDTFDTVLEYLVAEGYADTEESALVIMANMSEEWREGILEGRVASETMGSGERRWERNDRYREENPTLPSGNPTGVNAQLMRQMAHAKKRGVKKKKN